MSTLATALDLVQGRKIVLYFSEGFDGRLLVGSIARQTSIEQTLADNDAMMSGAAWSIDVDRRYASGPVQRQLDGAVDLLRRSRFGPGRLFRSPRRRPAGSARPRPRGDRRHYPREGPDRVPPRCSRVPGLRSWNPPGPDPSSNSSRSRAAASRERDGSSGGLR